MRKLPKCARGSHGMLGHMGPSFIHSEYFNSVSNARPHGSHGVLDHIEVVWSAKKYGSYVMPGQMGRIEY